ncbi:endonuclease NucS domain-containing protein [Niveispirillum sp.]|uniref:endonuclease NucS domain-containing protein n=1 Tax=Niveispirillum sp. TaxID=1917217 RepID=UPI0025DD68F6|nr:endonuclease NucS domain-containing protein [Niveispirillum sp.]
MTIHHAIWSVGHPPVSLARAKLPSEKTLEEMIVAAPEILSDSWMLIGRQAKTSHGGIIDLLAIAPDGTLVLIELKRDKTPWTVIAQALDYATWVESLEPQDIVAIYSRFSKGRSLSDDFRARFGGSLNDEMLNRAHEIVVVAAELDASSERIVTYLADRGIAINVLCFQVFTFGGQQLLSRVWLNDRVDPPVEKKSDAGGGPEPWNGEFYASFGVGSSRSWNEAVRYGFISAGGASWYSKTLGLLKAGDRIWVKSPDHGFVGVGIVTGTAEPAADFQLMNDMGERVPALDILKEGDYHRAFADDPDRCEWFVSVDWLATVPLNQAVKEIGLFGNQNTVCRPTTPKWRTTVEYLKTRFAVVDG